MPAKEQCGCLPPSGGHLRKKWLGISTLVRADSGFYREDLMSWCEANNIHIKTNSTPDEEGTP
jgi:hypothetical protein